MYYAGKPLALKNDSRSNVGNVGSRIRSRNCSPNLSLSVPFHSTSKAVAVALQHSPTPISMSVPGHGSRSLGGTSSNVYPLDGGKSL